MKMELKTVGPELATKWLEANIENNRPVSQVVVNAYARDMLAGNWRLTHQGICFDKKKQLIDGQHRLWAIVESGCSVEMYVATDADTAILAAVDQSKGRSTRDVLALTGQKPTTDLVSIANRMRAGLNATCRAMTAAETITFLSLNRPTIEAARAMFPNKGSKGVSQAAVKAVIARALYFGSTERAEKLKRFVDVLTSGFMGEGEEVIIILRDAIQSETKRMPGFEVYAKTSRALLAILNNESVGRLYAATSEYFPLPVEKMLPSDRPGQQDRKR